MKTQVETYIIEETKELIYDNEKLAQWNRHVEALGLQGQTTIQTKDKSPVPFLHMKKSLVVVFETLCPRKVKIETYDKTPIPVEILDLVALSKMEQYFEKVEIWYDDATPDPACIGFRKNSQFDLKYPTWEGGFEKYLIGRWADVKASLEQLTAKARVLFTAQQKSRIEQDIKNNQRKLEDLEHDADIIFGTTSEISTPDCIPF